MDFDNQNKKNKKNKISSYIQTTNYTCVASSYLMILNHFFPEAFPLNSETELMLHNKIKFWEGNEGEYGSYPKLAKHSLNLGLDVKLATHRISKPSFFSDELWKKYMDNYLPIIEELKNLTLFKHEDVDFDSNYIIDEINLGRIPILEIKYPSDDCTHHIVIRGYEGNRIKIIDPLRGNATYHKSHLNDLLNINYMKNVISISKPENLDVHLVASGISACQGDITGYSRVFLEHTENIPPGRILVTPRTDPDMAQKMMTCEGIITDLGNIICHAAIVAREIGIPCIVGTENATKRIKDGQKVYLDGDSGKVYAINYSEAK